MNRRILLRPSPSREAGFTLVELVVTLVLLALVTSIVYPRVSVRRARVDSAALSLTTRLMSAQRRAVVRQHDLRLLVDPDERTLVVHHDDDNDGFMDGGETTARHALEEGVELGRGDAPALAEGGGPVTFSEDPVTGKPFVTFHRNGSSSEEGAVYLTPREEGAAEYARAVRVQRATGQARCWSYRTGEWTRGC